jgi:hypothetical protein
VIAWSAALAKLKKNIPIRFSLILAEAGEDHCFIFG